MVLRDDDGRLTAFFRGNGGVDGAIGMVVFRDDDRPRVVIRGVVWGESDDIVLCRLEQWVVLCDFVCVCVCVCVCVVNMIDPYGLLMREGLFVLLQRLLFYDGYRLVGCWFLFFFRFLFVFCSLSLSLLFLFAGFALRGFFFCFVLVWFGLVFVFF